MLVGVLVFVAYALVQANQLGGSTPSYDVYDSDNYPLVSLTTQELPFECLYDPLATMQCTEQFLPPRLNYLPRHGASFCAKASCQGILL